MNEFLLIPKINVEHDSYGDDFNVSFQVRVAGVTLIEFVKYGVEGEREEVLQKYEKPDVDLIAVTNGPGLEPCLWVGVNFAKALAALWNVSDTKCGSLMPW